MGGPGSGRTPDVATLLRVQEQVPIAEGMYIPNYSGLQAVKKTDTAVLTSVPDNYLLNTGDTATGDYTFDTNTLFIDAANDRVGIGTTIPKWKLHIADAVGNPQILIEDLDCADANEPYAYFQTSNGIVYLGTYDRSGGEPSGPTDIIIMKDGNASINCIPDANYKLKIFNADDYQLMLDASGQYSTLSFAHNGTSTAAIYLDNTAAKLVSNIGSASMTLYSATGQAYFSANVSALSYTDRTPYPESLAISYDAINSVEGKEGKIDKEKMHPILKSGEDGRDLSMSVSVLLDVVKDLNKRIEELEKRNI